MYSHGENLSKSLNYIGGKFSIMLERYGIIRYSDRLQSVGFGEGGTIRNLEIVNGNLQSFNRPLNILTGFLQQFKNN